MSSKYNNKKSFKHFEQLQSAGLSYENFTAAEAAEIVYHSVIKKQMSNSIPAFTRELRRFSGDLIVNMIQYDKTDSVFERYKDIVDTIKTVNEDKRQAKIEKLQKELFELQNQDDNLFSLDNKSDKPE